MDDLNFDDIFDNLEDRNTKYYEEDRIRQDNIANKGNFRRGLSSGIDSTQGMLGGAVGIAGDALGIDSLRDWGFDTYESNMEEASLNPLDVQNFTDIDSVSDAGKWFIGTIGQLAPSMAEGLVSAVVGGGVTGIAARKLAIKTIEEAVESQVRSGITREVAEAAVKDQIKNTAKTAFKSGYTTGGNVGIVAGTGAMEGGGMWGEDAEKHGVENANALSASALGLVSGASELVSPGGALIQRLTGIKGKSTVLDKVSDTFLRRLGTEAPKAMGEEAAQEVFQSFLGVLNKKINDPTVSLMDREAIHEYINSAAAGAAGGLLFGTAGAAFPERPAMTDMPPELDQHHTVDDVSDDFQAEHAVESAVVNESLKAKNLTANTVPDILAGAGQPSYGDVSRLENHLEAMTSELFAKADDNGNVELPVWVKLKTLKDWENETGEPVKSYVSSKSAKETLKAVIAGQELTEKQQKVWGYLKSVAENRAMVQEESAVAEDHNGLTIMPNANNPYSRIEMPIGQVQEESAVAENPNGLTIMPNANNPYSRIEMPSNEVEEDTGLVPAFNPEIHGLGNEDPGIPDESTMPQEEEEPYRGEENIVNDDHDERINDMITAIQGQTNSDDLALIYEDIQATLEKKPELKPYIEKLERARKLAATDILERELMDGESVSTEPLPEPSTEKHEVIDNPVSAAHGQEMNTNPSDPQKKAENYKMVHVKRDGLDISIENPAGTTRKGKSPDGKEWESTMVSDYGRIKGTIGYDKDHVDVFMSAGYQGDSETVHIVNQVNQDGTFDEHKVVMGADSESAAMDLYNQHYEKGWTGGKSVVSMPVAEFKEWVKGEGPSKGELQGGETFGNASNASNVTNVTNGSVVEAEGSTGSNGSNPDTVNSPSVSTIVEHTTKAGKVIRGIVRTDITHAQAKLIDKFTFKKDGGFFIREKHLKEMEGKPVSPLKAEVQKAKDYSKRDNAANVEYSPGEIVATATGRRTTPFPEVDYTSDKKAGNTVKRIDEWLINNAIAEAESRNDDFAVQQFSTAKGGRVTQADKDLAKAYLFDPDFVQKPKKSVLKGLTPASQTEEPQGEEPQGTQNPSSSTEDNQDQTTGEEPFPDSQEDKEQVEPTLKPESTQEKKDTEWGSKNKLVSTERADELRAKLREKLNQLNSGTDFELAMLGMELAVFHIEAGARTFAEYARVITDDLGEKSKPFLRMWYNAARDFPGAPTELMDDYQTVQNSDLDAILNDKEGPTKKENELKAAIEELKALDEQIEHFYKLRECVGA